MNICSENLKEKLHLTCCLCLNLNKEMRSLFANELVQQLFDCTGIEIHFHQRLPSKICCDCAKQLADFHVFFTQCHRNHNYLKSLLDNEIDIKHEVESEFDYDPLMSDNETLSNLSKRNVDAGKQSSKNFVGSKNIIEVEKLANDSINKVKKKSFKSKRLKRLTHLSEKVKKNIKKVESLKEPHSTSNLIMDKNQLKLSTHLQLQDNKKSLKCSLCNRQFILKSSLKIHMSRMHLNKKQKINQRQTCENCGKTFSDKKNLKIHMRIHNGDMPYECTYCSRRFTQIGTLICHKRLHTGERPYICKICGRDFVENNHLRRHQSVHSEERPFICNICGKGLKSQFGLQQHTKLHTNEKEHICDQCGQSFMLKGNLEQHKRVKHSEKSGQCDICNKVFPNLKDHIRVHTGEKPFECNLCNKKFSMKRGLIIHNRQHTNADKFKCTLDGCDRSFSTQWILDCHIKKHTGYLPFSCKFCSKGYSRVCHLTQHLKLYHPNEDHTRIPVEKD